MEIWPRIGIVVLFSMLMTSCMVGPNYHSPAPPAVSSYTKQPLPKKTVTTSTLGEAGKAQIYSMGRDIPGEWWYLFHSPEINRLIEKGLAHSPNLTAAKATLTQAQENLNAQIGSLLWPYLSLPASGERQRFSGNSLGNITPSRIFTLYNVGVNVTYTLDVFGGSRRQIEAACAQVHYERFELEAAYLALTSNIVTTAISIASLRAQIHATEEIINIANGLLRIMNAQVRLGGASVANMLSQKTLVEQTRATLPPLMQQLAQANHALAVLVGELPAESEIAVLDLNKLNLPTQLPLSIPSRLVQQRPDIQAAEALLHQASAQIGVATANLYPQITLSGIFSYQDNTLSHLLFHKNEAWDYVAQLLQPIFKGGALRAQKREAIAAFQAAGAQYQQTILQAFQNVADTLKALENDAKSLRAQRDAELAASRSLTIQRTQYKLGGISYLSLLNIEQQYLQVRIARIKAQASRYADTAALFQAMGGGWWNRLSQGSVSPKHPNVKNANSPLGAWNE